MPDTLFADEFNAAIVGKARPVLTANRIYYVRKDGNNANTGLANTAGGACLTVMGALNKIASVDLNGFGATVQIGDGTYDERLVIPKMTGQRKTEDLILLGNLATPSAVTLRNNGSYQPVIEAIMGAAVTCGGGFTLTAPNNGYGINAAEAGIISVSGNVVFGPCGEHHAYANNAGTINFFNPYTISSSAKAHWASALAGQIYSATTVTINAPVTFSFAFAAAFAGGVQQINGNTFTLTNGAVVTGARYATQKNGVIETYGAGATYLPGSTAGSSVTGGQYG